MVSLGKGAITRPEGTSMVDRGDREVERGRPVAVAPPTRRRAAQALIAGGLFTPAAARAQTPPAGPPPPGSQPAGSAAPGASPASEPQSETLKTRPDVSQRMTAVVHINGQGPFRFLVDTGANQSGIATEVAAQLKLPPGQPVLVHGIAVAYLCQTVDIGELRIGATQTSLKNVPMFSREDLGADGLIGLDVLHDRTVRFDFLRQEIELTRRRMTGFSAFGVNSGSVTIPARQRFGQLTIIDSEAGRAKMTCFIDTGADQSVGNTALRLAVQARMRPEDVVNYDVIIRSVTGQYVRGVVALVPSMHIGGVSFTRFGLAFADLHTFDVWGLTHTPSLLVGMDLLRLFSEVSIDFSQREVTFEMRN
jgi:predicted aspartyl protease